MTDDEIETLIEPILRAAGTSLANYSLYKPREEMRRAMRTALTAAWEWNEIPKEIDTSKAPYDGDEYLLISQDLQNQIVACWDDGEKLWMTLDGLGYMHDWASAYQPLPAAPEVKP